MGVPKPLLSCPAFAVSQFLAPSHGAHHPRAQMAWPCYAGGSRKDALHELAVNVCQSEVASLELEREFFMVDAEAVKDGRVQVVYVDRIPHDVVTEFIGFAEDGAGPDPAAGEPD